jgi:methyltransferase (TIGR00027 family)
MSEKTISDLLGSTAFWTASVRALESHRPDCLFSDPWADALAGETGAAWIAQRSEVSVLPIVLRTRYFDDFLQRVILEQALRQVVLLGAGLDTRAYRLNWPPDTQCFELDQPAVLAHKNQVLDQLDARPNCQRYVIAADLMEPWQEHLLAAGFNSRIPSLWLLEGFLFYLPNESITQLIDRVTQLSTTGSWLGFDIINTLMLTHPLTRSWVEMQNASGAPWIGTMDDPVSFLKEYDWQANLSQAGAEDANHGRWLYPVIPVTLSEMPHNWYVTARKE